MQYNHFNQCIENTIPRILTENPNKFYEVIHDGLIDYLLEEETDSLDKELAMVLVT